MKKFFNIITIACFAMAGCYTSGQVARSDNYGYSENYDNAGVSYETFYNELQPYGNWINNPEYGNIWQPYASRDFRPYETEGHWVSTVDGWAWASDYNWGWAPFHYGRWLYDQSIGWAWVPGYEWAPAWVTWGQYNNYYAWAPLAPGINISFGNSWRAPGNYWSFVPRNYIGYSNLNRYAVRNNYNTNVNNITIINNYNSYNQKDYYHRGPDYREVEQITHRAINPVNIASAPKPGMYRVRRNDFEIYRPSMSANNSSPQNTNASNGSRQYSGGVRANSPTEQSINREDARNYGNPNIKRMSPAADVLQNGSNNGSDNVTRENIENSNRRIQQQQMENIRNIRRQPSSSDLRATPDRPARAQQFPSDNQQNAQQNNVRQQILRNNPYNDVQPVRPQSNPQGERTIQRPAFPQQSERIMRPSQGTVMPGGAGRRELNPVRSTPAERPIGRPQQRPF